MANIRIKDLANTASSTASDDFIAVDGTTNGTRKLNAFSPTFGGNATVTGTLTVNSTSPSVFAGRVRSNLSNTSLGDSQLHVQNAAASATNGALSQATFFGQPGYTTFVGTTGDGTTASYQGGVLGNAIRFNEGYVITDAANGLLLHGINGSIRLATGNPGSVKATFDSAGTLSLTATTASTTTSSGALVVGNGTSGGLGVGGAVNIGGALSMYGEDFTIHNVGYGSWTLRNTAGSAVFDIRNGAGSWLTFPGAATGTVEFKTLATTVKISATTASTSTSSGALVVSGGVGVAGAIYAGGYASTASHARIGASGSVVALSAANNVDSGLPAAWNGNYGLGVYYSAASTNTILMGDGSAGTTIFATRTGSANTSRITIDNTNGNTTFAGSISIGNTVNTVSPTSPNRTITMVIGGTTYYLAAKTTND